MEFLKYQQEGPLARITLNRPEVLNAMNKGMVSELFSLFKSLSTNDEVKVILVKGEGRAFSAGVDLKGTTAEDFQKGGEFMEMGKELEALMSSMHKVTIAQVHGYCFTGALELMMFFDLVFCANDTQFGDTHAKWAIMPRWGMSQRLARRVGILKAKELTFRAMRIKGEEAERLGLVNRSFPLEKLETEVKGIIHEMLENSFEAIGRIKQLYNEGWSTTLAEGLQIEYEADSKLSSTQDQIDAFEKKKFGGK